MEPLRMRWGHNGGNVTLSPFPNLEEQRSCSGRRNRPFPKQVNKKFFQDPKSQQQKMAQANCLRVVANHAGNSMSRTAHSSTIDHSIHSHPTGHGWRELSSTHPMKRMVDKDDISENLDQWVRDSVVEIVNNIHEAPFLVHIYSDDGREGSSSTAPAIRLVREKAVAESWPFIRGRWERGGSPIPNGVILVEELQSEADDDDEGTDTHLHSTTKVWGILIQGKGINCTACYILKTCRVQSLFGSCTHFCLVRVEHFVENADTLLKKLWLQT